jgi:hypothetical protein
MEEPERVKKLPHYKNLPIPYTTLIDANGKPQFKAIDSEKVWEVKRDKKCSVCGEPLDYWIAFMVTEEESVSRLVYENPNHEECLKYAFNVCPWLYYSKATYSDVSKTQIDGYEIASAHPERDESLNRPKKLGIYITNRYENKILPNRFRVCKVGKAKRLEWIDGK